MLLSLAVFAALVGCDSTAPGGLTMVRVENSAQVTFDQLVVYPGGPEKLTIADLAPGARSEYFPVSKAYQFASVRAYFGADSAGLQVIDYVGEQPLGSGHYTYVLGLSSDPAFWRLTLTLRRD
ncbi:MAG: hypothetical protein AB7L66_18395 [Gemmatimonadales bacterium]